MLWYLLNLEKRKIVNRLFDGIEDTSEWIGLSSDSYPQSLLSQA